MKKCLFMIIAICLSFALKAQPYDSKVIQGSNKITMALTPKQIIDSLHKRFPDAKSVEYYKTSAAAAKAGWVVSETDNLQPDEAVDYYTLSFKRANEQYYGLYKADGTLVRSKFQQSGVPLPNEVKNTLIALGQTNYKGYKIVSTDYYKTMNYDQHAEYYEITAVSKTDNSKKITMMLTPDGKLIGEK